MVQATLTINVFVNVMNAYVPAPLSYLIRSQSVFPRSALLLYYLLKHRTGFQRAWNSGATLPCLIHSVLQGRIASFSDS